MTFCDQQYAQGKSCSMMLVDRLVEAVCAGWSPVAWCLAT